MKVYRVMKVAADGLPEVGNRFGQLGVRPKDPANAKKRFDVAASGPTDAVHPGDGGMSVNADPNAVRPPDDEFVLWEIDSNDLGPALRLSPARVPHYHVEPGSPTTLAVYQDQLAATRTLWRRVE